MSHCTISPTPRMLIRTIGRRAYSTASPTAVSSEEIGSVIFIITILIAAECQFDECLWSANRQGIPVQHHHLLRTTLHLVEIRNGREKRVLQR